MISNSNPRVIDSLKMARKLLEEKVHSLEQDNKESTYFKTWSENHIERHRQAASDITELLRGNICG